LRSDASASFYSHNETITPHPQGEHVNPSDLDALAERSGLKLPPLTGERLHPTPAYEIAGICIAVALVAGLIHFLLVRLGNDTNSRVSSIKTEAPRLCAQRWRGSSALFVDNGGFSASIACGNPKSRIVTGHVEVAYP
jgi:hypothetical protein